MAVRNLVLIFWNRALQQFSIVVAACLYDHSGGTFVLLVILCSLFYRDFILSFEYTK